MGRDIWEITARMAADIPVKASSLVEMEDLTVDDVFGWEDCTVLMVVNSFAVV